MKRTFLLRSLSIAMLLAVGSGAIAAVGPQGKDSQFSNIDAMLSSLEQKAPAVPSPESPSGDVHVEKPVSIPPQDGKHPGDSQPLSVAAKPEQKDANMPPSHAVGAVVRGDKPASASLPQESSQQSSADVRIVPRNTTTLSERMAAANAERELKSKKSGETRVSDLPPYSRFDFVRDLFIPANKKGVVFVDGKPSLGVESTADPVRVMMERPESERSCVLVSDKNYVMMRGSSSGADGSFLELATVSFMEWSPASGASGMFVSLQFAPKPAKGIDGKDVNISLLCRVPQSDLKRMSETSLNQINDGFGGLFSFQLPQIIEI